MITQEEAFPAIFTYKEKLEDTGIPINIIDLTGPDDLFLNLNIKARRCGEDALRGLDSKTIDSIGLFIEENAAKVDELMIDLQSRFGVSTMCQFGEHRSHIIGLIAEKYQLALIDNPSPEAWGRTNFGLAFIRELIISGACSIDDFVEIKDGLVYIGGNLVPTQELIVAIDPRFGYEDYDTLLDILKYIKSKGETRFSVTILFAIEEPIDLIAAKLSIADSEFRDTSKILLSQISS